MADKKKQNVEDGPDAPDVENADGPGQTQEPPPPPPPSGNEPGGGSTVNEPK